METAATVSPNATLFAYPVILMLKLLWANFKPLRFCAKINIVDNSSSLPGFNLVYTVNVESPMTRFASSPPSPPI